MSPHQFYPHILSFTGTLLSMESDMRTLSFQYTSDGRCLVTVNREPHDVTVDGQALRLHGDEGERRLSRSSFPPGAHRVEIVAGDAFSYGVNLTSFWSSTAIAWFGVASVVLLLGDVRRGRRAPPHDGRPGKESRRMTLLEVDLSALFVVAVILIWFMIGYQFLLTVFGYINFIRSAREQRDVDAMTLDYPTCTILIPAHNEEKVIRRTVESMCRLVYPARPAEDHGDQRRVHGPDTGDHPGAGGAG